MALLGLLVGKFVVYSAFFLWAPRLLDIRARKPGWFALQWATARLALGLLGIIPVFLIASALAAIASASDAAFYAGLYGVRALIWAGMAVEICRRHPSKRPIPWTGWISLGLLLNLSLDVAAHAAGLDGFKYFC